MNSARINTNAYIAGRNTHPEGVQHLERLVQPAKEETIMPLFVLAADTGAKRKLSTEPLLALIIISIMKSKIQSWIVFF